MILHENANLFKQAIKATSDSLSIAEFLIEKDYWITFALKKIFVGPGKDYAVFKGGTSLSKCYKLIERFSEDIDLVIIHSDEDSDNKKKNKIKKISRSLTEPFDEIEVSGLTVKRGMIRKTCHNYPKIFNDNFEQVRNEIILEVSWLGYYEPYSEMKISSYIYDMMKEKEQQELINKYEMHPFKLKVLSLERTFCEKIMSLVRFSYSENPIYSLKMKIRHIYDLFFLLKENNVENFFNTNSFDDMLCKVGNDDKSGYRTGNEWINNHPAKALIFSDLDETWNQLKEYYSKEFKQLIYGELPNESEIYNLLKTIQKRLIQINWKL
ncbi:hypothetical protein C0585_07730 [Candidatus Woesearchaeota archaeon]|nr:MAG: hypothetical protein C0585_07730 [Candidatus Woesearchaeota archaeon]